MFYISPFSNAVHMTSPFIVVLVIPSLPNSHSSLLYCTLIVPKNTFCICMSIGPVLTCKIHPPRSQPPPGRQKLRWYSGLLLLSLLLLLLALVLSSLGSSAVTPSRQWSTCRSRRPTPRWRPPGGGWGWRAGWAAHNRLTGCPRPGGSDSPCSGEGWLPAHHR